MEEPANTKDAPTREKNRLVAYLDREIDVPGRVDDVDVMVTPCAKCSRRLDRDTFLSLEVH